MRRTSKEIQIGNVKIGGNNPIAIQSMTNADTADREKTLAQIKALEDAGCHIVRFTVNTLDAAKNIAYYKENSKIPLVADIHFDYKLALEAAAAGIDKIRINPGNIGEDSRIKAVTDECRKRNIPIRIGINGGSLEKSLLAKYGSPTAEAIAESGINAVRTLERFDFDNIVLSLKSSSVADTIKANRIAAESLPYPLHLGVTESGTKEKGIYKSAIGIGSLLADGIGDTIRVSLTADVVEEVKAAREILFALKLIPGITLISCPTCGRCKINLISIAKELQEDLNKIHTNKPITAALMGCVVNGPGEAKEADIGAAGGNGEAIIFKNGETVRKIKEEEIKDILLAEIKKLAQEN